MIPPFRTQGSDEAWRSRGYQDRCRVPGPITSEPDGCSLWAVGVAAACTLLVVVWVVARWPL